MTLREWAFREGLVYTAETGYRSISEIVHDDGHCLSCARWYVYRLSRSGRIVRLSRPGDPASVTRTEETELSGLTKGSFAPSA